MSAVDVRIGGADDWHYDLSNWSVVGDSTPLTPGDMSGGAGALSFTLPETAQSRYLHGRPCLLRDPDFGQTSGNLRLSGGNRVNATITGFSKIAMLNVHRTAEAFSGTLRGALIYYFGLCGVTTDLAVETSLASIPVQYIGWEGNVLDHIKDLCAAHQMELSLIGETFAFRRPGKRIITTRSFADYTWQANEAELAQNVEVAWYNTFPPGPGLVYPAGGWHDDLPVFQVDANEVAEYEIDLRPADDDPNEIGMSALTIMQPVCVEAVAREHTAASSVYAVAGKDGLPIMPEHWAATGGDLTVELLEGGSRLKVTITGPSEDEYAPYQIAMTSGASDSYSSLRIYGSGMRYTRDVLRMATGLSEERAPQEVASTVDSPFFSSYEAAWRAASGLLARHSAATYTIQGTIGTLETYSAPTPTFFGDVTVDGQDPATHAFGNLEGAVFLDEGIWFRIRTVTYTPNTVSFTAEQYAPGALDKIGLDLATGAATMTAAQWNAYYPTGLTVAEHNSRPLKGYTL